MFKRIKLSINSDKFKLFIVVISIDFENNSKFRDPD